MVGLDTAPCYFEVLLLEEMGLFFVGLCGEDEVLGNDGELVQDEVVGGGERSDEHCLGWRVEGVEEGFLFLLRRRRGVGRGVRRGGLGRAGFGGEGRGETQLELSRHNC